MLKTAMKYILFIFNLLFVLTGIALITVGLIVRSGSDEYQSALEDNYISAPNVLIFIGCFVVLVSFFGCCGALQENYFMIFTFSVIMAAIFVAELAVGVTGYVMKAEATEVLTTSLSDSMKQYKSTDHQDITQMWDNIQAQLGCCGAKNYNDWLTTPYHQIPTSCCKQPGAVNCTATSEALYKAACVDKLATLVKDNASTIGFTGLTIAVIQLLGVIFSCKLAHSIRHNYVSV